MNLFADSSALAKRYVADEKSEELDQLLQRATSLTVSVLCLPEIVSALCRRRRERTLSPTQYMTARSALEADLADATVIQITDEVTVSCVELLEKNALRSADAIQIACALAWHADVFVSADARQCAAAKASGLNVVKL
ncbi:MAG TPA: type II toxin-antitoxin system VapC family toxin [Terriglobia bacterium]|nr:type II toxin-antitoxin system VapC family toxin [Terriglobia bacterium]